jgi:2,4-dienoyl-CoA reductase-like NADH-dependent reductase (Old Yellow Enzyme family)
MAELFESSTINNVVLANRFVRSATWEGMADKDGSVTARLIDLMVQLARGGVGLIISGHAFVSREGQAGPGQLGVHEDRLVAGLAEMTRAVRQNGGRISLQLAHAGCQAATALSELEAVGPSVFEMEKGKPCRELTTAEIHEITHSFARGAARAKEAGFDAVQIHSAHGYLLSQFLSPYFNKRTDEYGGSVANRARAVLEVLTAIRKSVGDGFPVLIKLNSEDFLPDGFTVEDMLDVARFLEEAGIDGIELSGGTVFSGKLTPVRRGKLELVEQEVYYREAARRYKERIRVPLMLVGGIRSFEVAQQLVQEGLTDYISMSRPLVREPGLINRWKSGDRRKPACLSDNLCFKPAIQEQGIYCVVERKFATREGS